MARQGRNLTQSNHCRVFGWCRSWSLPLFSFPRIFFPSSFQVFFGNAFLRCLSLRELPPIVLTRLNPPLRASWVSAMGFVFRSEAAGLVRMG